MTWEDIGNRAQAKVWDSIPAEWLIPEDKMPPEGEADVTIFPYNSGMLTEHEIVITNVLASEIVQQVAKGEWKAESVARAFCKRAAIAHQLVHRAFAFAATRPPAHDVTDELPNGHHVRRSHLARQTAGRPFCKDWPDSRTSARPPRLAERQL